MTKYGIWNVLCFVMLHDNTQPLTKHKRYRKKDDNVDRELNRQRDEYTGGAQGVSGMWDAAQHSDSEGT